MTPETKAPDDETGAAVPALAQARDAWLSVGDAAALLGVSARAVQKRAERGTLPARRVKHGRALRWEIDGRELDGSGSQDVRKMGANGSRLPTRSRPDFWRNWKRKTLFCAPQLSSFNATAPKCARPCERL